MSEPSAAGGDSAVHDWPRHNVLVRYITQDDPEQGRPGTRLIETHCSGASRAGCTHRLGELAWVLRRRLRLQQAAGDCRAGPDPGHRGAHDRERRGPIPGTGAYREGPADFPTNLLP